MPCGCAAQNERTNKMTSTNKNSTGSSSDIALSARLAREAQALDELALPDEWYAAKGTNLFERFDAAAKAMSAKDSKALSGKELMARFQNGGKPFFHSVWLNQPYPCPQCTNGGAEGSFTVVSVPHGLSVTITSAEWHSVTAHSAAFPPDKLASLKKILEPR
jgi:hypothetical protein